MDTSGRQRRTRGRIRGKSDFAGFDEIALFSDALAGAESAAGATPMSAERLLMFRVISAWARAVGPHLRAVGQPVSCRQGRLVVDVRDAGWKKELERVRPEILSRMVRLLPDGSIRELSFRLRGVMHDGISPASAAQAHAERAPAATLLELPRPAARRTMAVVPPVIETRTQEDLGNQLRQVMGRYLARSH